MGRYSYSLSLVIDATFMDQKPAQSLINTLFSISRHNGLPPLIKALEAYNSKQRGEVLLYYQIHISMIRRSFWQGVKEIK